MILAPSNVPARERIHEAIRRHFESYRAEARLMGVIEEVSRYDEQVNAMRMERHRRYAEQVADSSDSSNAASWRIPSSIRSSRLPRSAR